MHSLINVLAKQYFWLHCLWTEHNRSELYIVAIAHEMFVVTLHGKACLYSTVCSLPSSITASLSIRSLVFKP